jgi:hypothetical protein
MLRTLGTETDANDTDLFIPVRSFASLSGLALGHEGRSIHAQAVVLHCPVASQHFRNRYLKT